MRNLHPKLPAKEEGLPAEAWGRHLLVEHTVSESLFQFAERRDKVGLVDKHSFQARRVGRWRGEGDFPTEFELRER